MVSSTTTTPEHAVTIDQCGHIFGHDCLTTWVREGHNTCPVCRVEIFTQSEIVIESHSDSDGPQYFALGVYMDVEVDSAVQGNYETADG